MTPAAFISLGLVGLMFLLWNAAMFHMLWTLNRRANERLNQTGGSYPAWATHSLKVFRHALTSDKDRPLRRRILWLSVLLALSIAGFTILQMRAL